MLYAKNKAGERILATKDVEATCPGCGSTMVAKMGNIIMHHWAHVKDSECDSWSEPEGEWHLGWKKRIDDYAKEHEIEDVLTIEKYMKQEDKWHFADIHSTNEGVTELQHSSISVADIEQRENFYGKMKWLFDVSEAYSSGRILLWEKPVEMDQPYYTFVWKRAKKTLMYTKKPLFLDLGNGQILQVQKKNINGKMYGWGYIIDYQWFISAYIL